MRNALLTLLLLLTLPAGSALAGVGEIRVDGTRTVLEQRCRPGRCERVPVQQPAAFAGTAVCLDQSDDGWILITCAHLFDGLTNVASTRVHIRGDWLPVEVLYRGRTDVEDLAVLRLRSPLDLNGETLSTEDARSGQSLRLTGYPRGLLTRLDGQVDGLGSATMTGVVDHGMSGGALVDARGELVGIASGSTDGSRDCAGQTRVGRHIVFVPISIIRSRLDALGIALSTETSADTFESQDRQRQELPPKQRSPPHESAGPRWGDLFGDDASPPGNSTPPTPSPPPLDDAIETPPPSRGRRIAKTALTAVELALIVGTTLATGGVGWGGWRIGLAAFRWMRHRRAAGPGTPPVTHNTTEPVVRSTVIPVPVDDGTRARVLRALDLVGNQTKHPPSFAHFSKLMREHLGLLESGDGVPRP